MLQAKGTLKKPRLARALQLTWGRYQGRAGKGAEKVKAEPAHFSLYQHLCLQCRRLGCPDGYPHSVTIDVQEKARLNLF